MRAAVIAVLCLLSSGSADAGEAALRGACLSLRVGPTVGNLPGTGLATSHLATPDGKWGFPLNLLTNDGVRIFNRELRPESTEAQAFAADYVTMDAAGEIAQYGRVLLNTLVPPDADGDGIPDFFSGSDSGTIDFSGALDVEWPMELFASVTGRASRSAGSLSGSATFAVSVMGQPIVQYAGPVDIITVEGTLHYEHAASQHLPAFRNSPASVAIANGGAATITARLANTAALTVQIRRFDGERPASGSLFFEIIDQNTLGFSAGELFSEGEIRFIEPFKLARSGNVYKGTFRFKDGDPSTPWPDFALYALSLTDVNDADADGIPDLSDVVADPPTYDWVLADREVSTGPTPAISIASASPSVLGDFVVRATTSSGVSTSASAQIAINELLWAKKAGSAGYDFPRWAILTPDRRVLMAATIQPIAVDGLFTEAGVIIEYDRSGAATTKGSLFSPLFAIPERVCLHANGDVTAAGRYAGSLQCGAIYIPSNGSTNGFLARFNSSGEAVSVRTFQKAPVAALAKDGEENLLVAGICEAGAIVGGISLRETGIFVARLSPSGEAVWARAIGAEEPGVGDIMADSRGDVVVTGGFYGQDGGGYSRQIYATKFSASGELLWSVAAGGNGGDYGLRLAPASDGDIYLAAATESSWMRFNGVQLPEFPMTGRVGLFKLDAEGRLRWARFPHSAGYLEPRVLGLRWMPGKGPLMIVAAQPGALSLGHATLAVPAGSAVCIAHLTDDGHTAFLQSLPIPAMSTVAADCDEFGEVALTLGLEREVEIGGIIYEPQLTDALTLYFGKPLRLRAVATGSSMRVAWPRTWPDAWLESCDDLNRGDWAARTRRAPARHFDSVFEEESNSPARFYRLKRPPP